MMLIIVKNTTVMTWLFVLSIPFLFLSETSSVALTFSNTIEEALTTTNLRTTTVGNNGSQSSTSDFFDAVALAFSTDEIDTKTKGNLNVEHKNENSRRQLDQTTKRTFPECIEQKLSPEDCHTLIQKHIDDAGGHEVGDVTVKIQTPRTPEEFADSYWMIEVPVNAYGKMACDRNQGNTFYPFKWNDGITGTALDVADQDCLGLTAGECCLKIRDYGKQLTASGYDNNKQCLSCFVHQEPLEPVLNKGTGQTDYLECKDLEDGTCVQGQLSGDEVDALDSLTAGRVETAIESMETFQTSTSCDTFDQLLEDLYNAAVVIKPLSIKIGRLACMVCYGEHDLDLNENASVSLQLEDILTTLKKHNPPKTSKENCIIIYTNTDGEVVKDPTLGGSRSDGVGKSLIPSDFCQNDFDCGDTEWCFNFACYENRCITDPPTDCQREDQICIPSSYYDEDYYVCENRSCGNDPYYSCEENEFCTDYRGIYYCEPFAEVGEACGSHFDEKLQAYVFFQGEGECNPSNAFCYDPKWCFDNSKEFKENNGECRAYGEGLRICRDFQTKIVDQDKCNSDEYCDQFDNRCRPNNNLGECCDPTLNNCGYGIDDGKLTCAPQVSYAGLCEPVYKYYTCQVRCETDNDCEHGKEWCAPVDEDAEWNGGSAERFCKAYLTLWDYCNIRLPDLRDPDLHTEERCDPAISYCVDPNFCNKRASLYYDYDASFCVAYGNACQTDDDCEDGTKEWCDVDVGHCKDRLNPGSCCTTLNEGHRNDCTLGAECREIGITEYQLDGTAECTLIDNSLS